MTEAEFKAAGLDPEAPPTNWDEFESMAKQLWGDADPIGRRFRLVRFCSKSFSRRWASVRSKQPAALGSH